MQKLQLALVYLWCLQLLPDKYVDVERTRSVDKIYSRIVHGHQKGKTSLQIWNALLQPHVVAAHPTDAQS